MSGGYSIAGGNDQICHELARRLGERVQYNSPVRSVEHNNEGIILRIETDGGISSVRGDIVILTPPPPVLQSIDFQPALSQAKAEALSAAIAVPVTLTFAQTRSRFWLTEELDGNANTDLVVGGITHPTASQDGTKGVLASLTYNGQATAMADLEPAQRVSQLREALARLYPDSLDLDEPGTSYAWGDDPWHRCGHVSFRPGTYVNTVNALRQPQGRLFFAGDTMGGVSGYSHSAFASGQEVANLIIDMA